MTTATGLGETIRISDVADLAGVESVQHGLIQNYDDEITWVENVQHGLVSDELDDCVTISLPIPGVTLTLPTAGVWITLPTPGVTLTMNQPGVTLTLGLLSLDYWILETGLGEWGFEDGNIIGIG